MDNSTGRQKIKSGLILLALAAVTVFAGGQYGDTKREGPADEIRQEDVAKNADTQAAQSTVSVPTEAAEENTTPLSEAQYRVTELLYEKLKSDDLEGAARLINANSAQLQSIYYDALEEKRYLFDGDRFSEKLVGDGMVITKPGTVFFGHFENGAPSGQAMALQAMILETPRYDYTSGTWMDGYLDGPGVTGYLYYDGTGEDVNPKVERRGDFDRDVMDGDVWYSSTNPSGNVSTWNLKADGGITRITDKWIYDKNRQEYKLPSVEDETRVFVLSAEEAVKIKWYNFIKWQD